jgi:hypothetical protein
VGHEVVIEATGNAMVVSHLPILHLARVVTANPLQVKAIVHAHMKTDKIDAGVLASLYPAGCLPQVWTPDAAIKRQRRLWRDATKWSGTAPDSRTRRMRSCTRTSCHAAACQSLLTGPAGPG